MSLLPRVFSEKDLEYLQSLGKTQSQISKEYSCLFDGVPYLRLKRPCRQGDGIHQLDISEQERLASEFKTHADQGRALKFIAASGAASRMFTSQIYYSAGEEIGRPQLLAEAMQGNAKAEELLRFFDNLPQFPFFDQLRAKMEYQGFVVQDLLAKGSYSEILRCLLDPDGLGYAGAPKGLIPFHRYPDGDRTAFEEHLIEAAAYVRDLEGSVRIHFTVAPGEEDRIRQHLSRAATRYQEAGTRYIAGVSIQDRSTDTVALESNNSLVRDEDGNLCLWPSGHGALLNNLNALQGDIVFIRTVDNVLPDRLKGTVGFFKRVLGGLLAMLQAHIFSVLEALESGSIDERGLRDVEEWIKLWLNLHHPIAHQTISIPEKTRLLFGVLNRPLRVCAMVRHEGEPGGGPFWVENQEGRESLQIVESAQVDMSSQSQRKLWESSTYFNPADLVCGIRDYRGKPFDLSAYADSNARFISVKRPNRKSIRVLERPGLWNGSMAFWNSVFVEVPRTTLSPVKNVMDLLNPEHHV
jgi:hypothetical protein